ncbi:MAG: transketolase [Rickettsiales bacterium]|jgi:transketolase|nr:transketolase [Rickettsiales bacterium]
MDINSILTNSTILEIMANALRFLSIEAISKANSGHPGLPLGFADVATVLFTNFLKFNPRDPDWFDRDRFVLSAGHGSILLYSLLYLTGYEDCTLEDIKNFRQIGSKTAGHPEYGHLRGVETTTGPLGQGVANAVGMAIAERHMNAKFGDKTSNHKTYCMVGDGCLMEGISYEALSIAGNLCLKNLVLLWDNNEITIDGNTSITRNEDMKMRMESIGFKYLEADGHNYGSIQNSIGLAQNSSKPVFISFKTKIGFASPKEGSNKCHGSPLTKEELEKTKEKIGYGNWQDFKVPDRILDLWRSVGHKNDTIYKKWLKNNQKGCELEKFIEAASIKNSPDYPIPGWMVSLHQFNDEIVKSRPEEATRKSSQRVLEVLTKNLESMIGGSADLTSSVLTDTESVKTRITKDSFEGRYINYGIREHAMAGIMNGLALHDLLPYGGTFLCFADYARPSIRLAALMGLRCLFIFTHDSIGLGEDGPTHQPVEHLASLRAIPNLNVFRPASLIETSFCYEIAITSLHTPSALVLSRQAVPFISAKIGNDNPVKKGAYILAGNANAAVTIIATGTEVALALEISRELEQLRILNTVVSAPCLNIFDQQSEKYRDSVISPNTLKVAIEAGGSYGWQKYIGRDGLFFGIRDNSFGVSGPAQQVYEHFGITKNDIVEEISQRLERRRKNSLTRNI